ncbi:MAG: 50S ribosomal protein L25 [Candidatus Cloacimonadota bacterium]|nr:MAG: 50S ribosomal protein L25 [Candidatus Cloacimonadota bacterium]PIE79192.1 MAG: 50S ribosomal protein L25 [Candidatus Delongbacteria bacterium]
MAKIVLKGEAREVSPKKSFTKKLRKAGKTPAVVYGYKQENSYITVSELELMKAFKSGEKVFTISTEAGDYDVIIKEIQRHPVTWQPLHVDFIKLVEDKEVAVKVPLVFKGTAFGVKNMGGVLLINSRHISVRTLPKDIPTSIDVDVTSLKISDTLHAGDLDLGTMKLESSKMQLLASCAATRASVSAQGAAAATATSTATEK